MIVDTLAAVGSERVSDAEIPAEPRPVPVESADGARVTATVRLPATASGDAPSFLLLPAMGVRATYYAGLAEALARRGCASLTADLRGHGTSSVRPSRHADFGYREMVELDLPALLAAARRELPPGRHLVCLGHSLGGQMACLASARLAHLSEPETPLPSAIVTVASCSVYYRCWGRPKSVGVYSVIQTARLSSWLFGYYPGHLLGFAGREARGVIRDWWHQGTTGRYHLHGSEHDYESLLANQPVPILALSFHDDPLCPSAAVEHLLAKMPTSPETHLHLHPSDLESPKLGHFDWIRSADALIGRVLEWSEEALRDPAADRGSRSSALLPQSSENRS